MQYDVQSPEEYLEKLENGWREEKLLEVRRLIRGSTALSWRSVSSTRC
ncbi:MAG: hypothetical protein WBI99_03330 [Limnochordia bacterium]|nr:hypothetical protein [Limnochordia bacterium]HOK31488.1 hypothetical protein [Limnochordia bacterium]HOM00298.1 hypothetical protein [Limnochordia bacterium]HPP72351.1 hypothetical protein [Limnochordia bacterium]HPU65707.1 hypothetical protein [Limnochordia bacterium]